MDAKQIYLPIHGCWVLLCMCYAISAFAGPSAEDYSATPFAETYAERHAAFVDYELGHEGNSFTQLIWLEQGRPPVESKIQYTLDKMNARLYCADFGMQAILRYAYHHAENPLLSDAMKGRIKKTLLDFKYWPDEPGIDSMCSWSENHFILFATGGYLAGQLYPDEVFTNSGRTSREQMERFKPRVERWHDLRYKMGFSEWLSNVYYEEDFAPLLNLVDLSEDENISRRAAMVTDLLLADMALNSYRGVFGSTHGRSYAGNKTRFHGDNTRGMTKIAFGLHTMKGGMGSVALAVNRKYRIPSVIYEMAVDGERPFMINKQRMSMNLEDAPKYGLDFNRLEDGMTFLTYEAYCHPRVINLFARMLDEYNWWENEFFEGFAKNRALVEGANSKGALPPLMWYYQKDVTRNHRPEVNIYTYRTPHYMLSTAQDHRKGYGGDQQSIWQATLGPAAVCFTTHPDRAEQKSPNYWTGSGNLPRAAQVGNVVIALYKISTDEGLYLTHAHEFTHAWLPKDQFDAVVEKDGWVFARKDQGYLALWSKKPTRWQTEGEYADKEIIADGKKNIWICEMGSIAEYRSFRKFMSEILKHPVEADGLSVIYQSPSQGELQFSWNKALIQNERPVRLDNYGRYDNPYADAPFPGDKIRFELGKHHLELDWETATRMANAYLEP